VFPILFGNAKKILKMLPVSWRISGSLFLSGITVPAKWHLSSRARCSA